MTSQVDGRDGGAIAKALTRISENPALYKSKTAKGKNVDPVILQRIADLKENVEGISVRQISSLLGIGKSIVGRAVRECEAPDWSTDNNQAESAAHLSALTLHHPDRRYEDHPDAETETSGVPVLFTSPAPNDPHRRADQSHAVKRPITLAREPFNWRNAA